jgi:hypothetical protein
MNDSLIFRLQMAPGIQLPVAHTLGGQSLGGQSIGGQSLGASVHGDHPIIGYGQRLLAVQGKPVADRHLLQGMERRWNGAETKIYI